MRRLARFAVVSLLGVALVGVGALPREAAPAQPRTKGKEARKTAKPARGAAAPRKSASPPGSERRKALQFEQQELKQELARLKQQLMAAEASRTEAADALAASEAAISRANRRLRELGEARAQLERQIDGLQQRTRVVLASESRQQELLAATMRQHDRLTLRDPMRAFLAGDNPAELARDAEYYGYLGRAADRRIADLQERRAELAALEAESRQKHEELAAIADDEAHSRTQLLADQARRKLALDRLAKQIATQRQSIDKLERDERRLGTLIDQLSKLLAEQARRDAEREAARKARESAAAESASKPVAPPRTAPPRAAAARPEADPPPSSEFAQLRGRLPMPVIGDITGRFGAPRKVEGAGSAPTWKGIFIRAEAGTGVRAVAPGQVVFADWLRGFGNLMVIDHGGDFLSVYGNNESLLRNVGDRVAVGDVVAAVGNTGGIEQTGLYFELRFQGRPFDPLKWVAAR